MATGNILGANRFAGFGLLVALMIGVVGLMRGDLVTSVEFRFVRVLSVQIAPGRDASYRVVIVDLGDRRRAIRTSDRYLDVRPGQPVCLRTQHLLLRRWVRYGLALPGYCRHIPVFDLPHGPRRP